MLATNKPLMGKNFSNLVKDGGLFYHAAKNAHYETSKHTYDTQMNEYNAGISDGIDPMPEASDELIQKWTDAAEIFAAAFVKELRDGIRNNVPYDGLDTILTNEIDKHVKSAQIDINIPVLLPTILSPMGPCTGSLSISTSTGAQITIS